MMAASENLAYGYNARSELVSAVSDTDANYNYAYAFDHIGNRATEAVAGTENAYATNSLNQYLSVTPAESPAFNPSYDADGNVTSVQTSTGTWAVEYNAENRPVRWTNAATGTVITMTFDSQGRRTEYKSVTNGAQNTWLRFLYDGYLCVQVLYSNEPYNVFKEFVWDPTEPVATRPLVFRYAPNSLNLFYTFDGNKNVSDVFYRMTSNGIGAHYDYAPFGGTIRTHRDSSASFDIVALNPFRFSSEYYDSELDLVYYNFRHYSPSLGRFLSRDPIAEQGGLNLYAFVGNSGLQKIDTLGLFVVIFAKELLIGVGKEAVLATLKRGFGYIIHVGNLTTALRSACIDKRAGSKMWSSVELTAGSLEILEELKLKMSAITFDAAIGALWQKSVISKNFRRIYKGKLDSLAREFGYEKFDQKIANMLEGVVVGDVSEKIRNGISKEIGAPSVSMKVRVTKIDKRNRKITYRMKVGATMTIFGERISVEDTEKSETISPNVQLNQPCFCGN